MRRTLPKLALALGAALLLAGCWDRVELPDLEVVTAAAFDAAPSGGVQVTISIVLPANLQGPGGGPTGGAGGGGGAAAPATAIVAETAPTLAEATTKLSEELPGHIFWGHTRVILIGAALAERGIAPVVDFFMRDRTTRLSTDVVVTRGEAGPLLTQGPPYRTPASDVIYEELRRRFIVRAPAYKVAESLLVPSAGILIPEVEARTPTPRPGASANSQSGSVVTPTGFSFQGAGVFEAGRLRGWTDIAQMRGALWLSGRTVESSVTIDAPSGVAVTSRLEQVRFNRRAIRLAGGQPAVQIQVDVNDAVSQVDSGHPPLDQPQYLVMLSHLLAVQIRQYAESALALAHSQGVDFLGFSRLVAEYQPSVWRNVYQDWPATFRQLPVVLNVRAHVRSTGNVVNLP